MQSGSRLLPFLRTLFAGQIDARTLRGKLTLLGVVLLLSQLFNWESTIPATIRDFQGLFGAEHPFPHEPNITAKIARPFAATDPAQDPSRHYEKLAFRFVPFLFARVLHLDHLGLCCAQILLGLLFPLMVWRVLFEATGSLPTATAGTVLLNGLYAGFAFFYDIYFFDAFAYFLLLGAMRRGPRWVSLLLMLGAAFTDERALLASCFVPLWRLLAGPDPSAGSVSREALWHAGFLVLYVAMRLGIGAATGLETGRHGIGLDLLRLNLPNIVLLVWSVFEGGWIVVLAAAFGLGEDGPGRRRVLGGAVLVGLAAVFLGGLLVGDAIRSQQYAFPVLLIGLAVVSRRPGMLPARLMALAIILTLLSPITIYLGMDTFGAKTVYNLFQLKPGYLDLFGL